jgi:hypothetical protein
VEALFHLLEPGPEVALAGAVSQSVESSDPGRSSNENCLTSAEMGAS